MIKCGFCRNSYACNFDFHETKHNFKLDFANISHCDNNNYLKEKRKKLSCMQCLNIYKQTDRHEKNTASGSDKKMFVTCAKA